MKVVITGSRNDVSRALIENALEYLPEDTIIIHGAAPGVDRNAGSVARKNGYKVVEVAAEWENYGRAAGAIRNIKMLDMRPDLVLAFHTDLKKSRGTWHCVSEATKRGIPVVYIEDTR